MSKSRPELRQDMARALALTDALMDKLEQISVDLTIEAKISVDDAHAQVIAACQEFSRALGPLFAHRERKADA